MKNSRLSSIEEEEVTDYRRSRSKLSSFSPDQIIQKEEEQIIQKEDKQIPEKDQEQIYFYFLGSTSHFAHNF
jgi:hypothetical protein